MSPAARRLGSQNPVPADSTGTGHIWHRLLRLAEYELRYLHPGQRERTTAQRRETVREMSTLIYQLTYLIEAGEPLPLNFTQPPAADPDLLRAMARGEHRQ